MKFHLIGGLGKRYLKYFLVILFFSGYFSVGCAYKSVSDSRSAPTDPPLHQKRQITTTKAEIPLEQDLENFSDEDFIDDEFEEDEIQVADPISLWNRAMFHFNDKLYFWALKPVSQVYKAVTPYFFRIGVKNFFRNITTPVRLVNCILQWKGQAAQIEFSRFMVNTTIGVLGLGNPADKYPELNPYDEEDMGQTLAKYGIGNGFYIIWPFLGPSTLRDSIGLAGDWFLNPINYVEPTEASWGIVAFDKINQTSFRIGEYESLKEAAIDPYTAFQDIYLQFREKKIEK